ncbi:MAG: DUF115 domain-containing protein, partial [Spirochaetes bacterium]|nr:DUF115 domain-containing protein [Spirochaetota bacterium]
VQKEQAPFASQIGQAQFARSVALPVFLAAGGPSLDSALPFLGEIRQRAIVVAVDTSMRFFVKNGVAPDFVVVVDPQFWNSRHLDTCLTGGETRLIAESAVYPPVLRLPFKGRFLCGSLFPLGSFIESRVDPKGALGAGGSVATTAWDFCRTLAPSEIWIAGLDLAFPGLKTHFRGALFESIISAQSRRLKPAETMLADALRNGGSFYAPGAGGEPVLTDKRLSLYAAWFENRFRQAAGLRNFRLFSSGLAIANIEKAGIEQFLALPPRRQEIDDRLQAAFAKIDADFFDRQAAQSRADKYEKALSVLRRGLEQVKEASEKGASVARRALAGKTKPGAQNGILKELDEILQSVSNSEVKEVAGFLFPPAENLKAGGSADNAAGTAKAADPFRSYLESSLELFESLAAASSDNLKELV